MSQFQLFFKNIFTDPLIYPFLFFTLSTIAKFAVRAESIKKANRRATAIYIGLSNGSRQCLVALSMITSISATKIILLKYANVQLLITIPLIYIILYFFICVIEHIGNDPERADFYKGRIAWLGLHFPNIAGSLMIWFSFKMIRG